jgi:hypothetical protein
MEFGYLDAASIISCTTPSTKHQTRASYEIKTFINVYKPKIIKKFLRRVVFCGRLSKHGFSFFRGTYNLKNKTIFVEIDNFDDTSWVLHHEFSSLLFYELPHRFNKAKWKSYNGAEYKRNWHIISAGWEDNKKLQQKGFLYPYSQYTLEDDFNVMSGLYLANKLKYTKMIASARRFPRINGKYILLRNFYKGLLR